MQARWLFALLGSTLSLLLAPVLAVAAELIPVRIATNPEGAAIYVNGVPRGETPTVLHLPTGSHEIFLYREGQVPIKRQVEWTAEDRPIMNYALRPQRGGLVVLTDPPRTEVLLNGRPLGRTPLAFENLPAGEHRLSLRRDGFDPYDARISLGSEETRVVDVRLSGPPVFLWVEARQGAHIYLDGSYAGQVTEESLGLRVRPGRHEVRVVHSGFASLQYVDLEPGQDAFVTAGRMHRIPGYVPVETKSLNPRWFAVGAGLGVGAAGSVVMAASLYQAHGARRDYDNAWRLADMEDSRQRIQSGNRRSLYGAAAMAVGGVGAWLAWPSPASPSVAWTGEALLLSWRWEP